MWQSKADGLNSIVFSNAVGVTQMEIMLAEQRGRELRSQAIAGFFRKISKVVKSWRLARRNRRVLEQLDDRMLKDIGLTRGEINHVVGAGTVSAGVMFAPLVKFGVKVANAIKGWNDRRNAYRQLANLDDHMLEDIGIMRHEIASIAYRGKVRKPILHAPVSVQSLRSQTVPGVASVQDSKPQAA
jgi:uncharacterized protein YjiS (DUF1127 family)